MDIRKVLLDPAHKDTFSKRAELWLFCGDRAQHVDFVIIPAIAKDSEFDIVLCDRYEAVMYAYQYFTRGACTIDEFHTLNDYATGGLKQNFTFILDLDFETGKERNGKAGKGDRFELEGLEFHNKGREGFKDYCMKQLHPGTWEIVDATENEVAVFEKIKNKINLVLGITP